MKIINQKKCYFITIIILFFLVGQYYTVLSASFSFTCSKVLDETSWSESPFIWQCTQTMPFNECIVSWNGVRPEQGVMTLWVSVRHEDWSPWHRLAHWTPSSQRTFINKLDPYVHTKHVLCDLQKGKMAHGFRVKATFEEGADPRCLRALFVCMSDMKKFSLTPFPLQKPTVVVDDVPTQSQMVLDHKRKHDFCSPTATSILVSYFMKKQGIDDHASGQLDNFVVDFADKVHDKGYLDIYGNWLLNVAHASHETAGSVMFRVERLNSFYDLYKLLQRKIPVAVSVRRLKGGATPYKNGHFIVVVGWDKKRSSVVCIDPAFQHKGQLLQYYKLWDFLKAWARSKHLSYVPIPLS